MNNLILFLTPFGDIFIVYSLRKDCIFFLAQILNDDFQITAIDCIQQ